MIVRDQGDRLVVEPLPDDPISALAGSLKDWGGPNSDEIRRRERELDREREERRGY